MLDGSKCPDKRSMAGFASHTVSLTGKAGRTAAVGTSEPDRLRRCGKESCLRLQSSKAVSSGMNQTLVISYQHRTPHRTGITAGLKRMIFTTSNPSSGVIMSSWPKCMFNVSHGELWHDRFDDVFTALHNEYSRDLRFCFGCEIARDAANDLSRGPR